MIAAVEGPPGNGKSFYAIRKAAMALAEGKVVATNVELAPDAFDRIAARNPLRRGESRRRRADELRRHCLVTDDLAELFSLRLRGRGESRGVMVLDEAHNWMNARSWSADDRASIVRFFTQHRKLGWDVYLITQDVEMIDRQVRGLAEYVVTLRNLKRAKWGGIPVSPVNLFLAVWRWHAIGRTVVKRELFPLDWTKDLYDTHQLSHGLTEDNDGALWLPREPVPSLGSAGRSRGLWGRSREPSPVAAPQLPPSLSASVDLSTGEAEHGQPHPQPDPLPVGGDGRGPAALAGASDRVRDGLPATPPRAGSGGLSGATAKLPAVTSLQNAERAPLASAPAPSSNRRLRRDDAASAGV